MNEDVFNEKLDRDPPARQTNVSPFRFGQSLAPHTTVLPAELPIRHPIFTAPSDPSRVWESLTEVMLDPRHLEANRLISVTASKTAAATFDVLRTRILQALAENGWTRIAITSPTGGCGSSFVAANLALSLARKASTRTVLFDLELRNPALARMLKISDPGDLRDLLRGDLQIESHLLRVGQNLALALNETPATDAAELLLEPETTEAIELVEDSLRPDVVLFDMPPALSCDDVIAFLPQVDAVLLVADATRTRPADISACERLFEGKAPLLGVVLNRAEDRGLERLLYEGDTPRRRRK